MEEQGSRHHQARKLRPPAGEQCPAGGPSGGHADAELGLRPGSDRFSALTHFWLAAGLFLDDMTVCSNQSLLSEGPGDRFLLEVSARKKKKTNLSLLINWYISFSQRNLQGQSKYLRWVSRER